MLTDGVFHDSDAKDPIELSRLAGLSLARVSSALSAGESRGLFQRHLAPARIVTGGSNARWRLSASLTDLAAKFADFAEDASRFSQEIAEAASMHPANDVGRNVEFNLEVAKTVFGKWSVDILTLIYAHKTLGYQEILRAMPGMSARVLSDKLSRLQELGLVHREVLDTKPPGSAIPSRRKGCASRSSVSPCSCTCVLPKGCCSSSIMWRPRFDRDRF